MSKKFKTLKTGLEWAAEMNLKFNDLAGFESGQTFHYKHISKTEFLLRASNCKIEKTKPMSRRDAAQLRKEFQIGNE